MTFMINDLSHHWSAYKNDAKTWKFLCPDIRPFTRPHRWEPDIIIILVAVIFETPRFWRVEQ